MAPFPLQDWHKSSDQRNSSHSKTIDGWSGEGGSCCTTGGVICIVTRTIRDIRPIDLENMVGCDIHPGTLVSPSRYITSWNIKKHFTLIHGQSDKDVPDPEIVIILQE